MILKILKTRIKTVYLLPSFIGKIKYVTVTMGSEVFVERHYTGEGTLFTYSSSKKEALFAFSKINIFLFL